ncbi:MAG TPA: hypothetical protein VIP70_07055 [Nitrososphaeraceae archaeon]|jgi:hypothetical protein
MTAVRSYFAYYDIDVISSKFKRKVKMPKVFREDEEPIESEYLLVALFFEIEDP